MTTNFQEIDSFFENPMSVPPKVGQYSVLHLLRRDILTCFGVNPNDNSRIEEFMALWPGTMAIFAGIDLLGKFYEGDDLYNRSGERFKKYIRDHFQGISSLDEEILYHLRNAMLHSFGLISKNSKGQIKFSLSCAHRPLVTKTGADDYHVDIRVLCQKFEESISNYQGLLIADSSLQANFKKMIDDYGFVGMI